MFTPPPSPIPPKTRPPPSPAHLASDELLVPATAPPLVPVVTSSPSRYKSARRLRWSVLVVPFMLILIAAATRFLAHPAAFDLLVPGAENKWDQWSEKILDWRPHSGHSHPSQPHDHLGTPSPILSRRAATPTVAPPVPQNPMLPTPFPQPFDTTLSTNFSTTECYNFFLNMTQTTPFRSCRPFSLLVTHSQAFQEAQNNITQMNTDIWGTCNTDLSWDQCNVNMAWFASALQSSCVKDFSDQNAMVAGTLTALQAYDLMRKASCQVDTATNAYCYVESVGSSDPSSYWFYLLPLGQPLLGITTGACNECTRQLMATYAGALANTSVTPLGGLQQTYENAAKTLDNACGSNYAQTVNVSNAAFARTGIPHVGILLLGVLLAPFFFTT
ncbi:hypothetical protein EDC04DRAFT_2866192 [Pisolithus marmoratus]|nr:hypothetical protein EDC04DRAFT_2866192 [Pisolithus marmoratus]